MNSYMRNELLQLISLLKDSDKQVEKEILLQQFEYDIDRQLEDLEHKKEQLLSDKKTLEYVKERLGVK